MPRHTYTFLAAWIAMLNTYIVERNEAPCNMKWKKMQNITRAARSKAKQCFSYICWSGGETDSAICVLGFSPRIWICNNAYFIQPLNSQSIAIQRTLRSICIANGYFIRTSSPKQCFNTFLRTWSSKTMALLLCPHYVQRSSTTPFVIGQHICDWSTYLFQQIFVSTNTSHNKYYLCPQIRAA